MNTWMPFLRILSAMVCMVKVFPAPEQPKIQMLLFLYCLEFKASNLEKELITTDRQELLEILAKQKKQAV
jgi:hypothetical protein